MDSRLTEAMERFRSARFGLFLHWGLYALPGGRWRGETMDYIGEWLQSRFRIPNREYRELAARFNPVGFDADEWIRLARDAGMRYIVYTAKHHDGFAMYHSKVSRFNIVDATPFGRDPLRELAEACRKYGLGLGIYYSHHLDWEDPDGGDPGPDHFKNMDQMSWGNDWDFPELGAKSFERYFRRKALPQITELLTQYGEVCELWCDCFLNIKAEFSRELRELVHTLQPGCLINSRIGNGCGDFESLGDNQLMNMRTEKPVECPLTLNHTWGYKYDDCDYKSAAEVLRRLAALAARNANMLLNIGPQPDGRFPAEAVGVLKGLAAFQRKHPDVIAGSMPSPFPQAFPWGDCTVTGNRLNLFVWNHRERLVLDGVESRVLAASVPFTQSGMRIELRLNDLPREELRVITLEFAEAPRITARLIVGGEGCGLRPAAGRITHGREAVAVSGAERFDAAAEKLVNSGHSRLNRDGTLEQWQNPGDWISWEITFAEAGEYELELVTLQRCHSYPWLGGRTIEFRWGDRVQCCELNLDVALGGEYYRKGLSRLGAIRAEAGESGVLSLRCRSLNDPAATDMNLEELRLTVKNATEMKPDERLELCQTL